MNRSDSTWVIRTIFFGIVTNRHDGVKVAASKFLDGFRKKLLGFNAKLSQHDLRLFFNESRFCSSARNIELLSKMMAQERFGHLGSGTIMGANEQYGVLLFAHAIA